MLALMCSTTVVWQELPTVADYLLRETVRGMT
jgi:hypothetical protein